MKPFNNDFISSVFASMDPAAIESDIPTGYNLSQNYPNPFNPTTTIEYSIPKSEKVVINVFDASGREVATLENKYHSAGSYRVNFNANQLASGVYIYSLTSGDFSYSRKMLLIK